MKKIQPAVIVDTSKIIDYLMDHTNRLDTLYKWPIKGELVTPPQLTEAQSKEIKEGSWVEQNLRLRRAVSGLLNEYAGRKDKADFQALASWIIREWGGIKGGKESIDFERTSKFKEDLGKKEKCQFDRIASMSKILAFWEPENFAIYDSRVAYSLNWILLRIGTSRGFFSVPLGRNTKLNGFDIEVIIRLYHNDFKLPVEFPKGLFMRKGNTYASYLKLLRTVARDLWPSASENALQKTEMLLFALADTQILEDIGRRVRLTI